MGRGGIAEAFVRLVSEPVADPRPIYAALREHAPVYRTPQGFWYVSRHDLGSAILRNDALWSVAPANAAQHTSHPTGFASDVMSRIVLRTDGVDHARLRRLVSPLFTGRAAERMRDRVTALIEEQLDRLDGREEVELVGDFARLLPTMVILEICGIDLEHLDLFVGVADSLIAMHEPTVTAETVAEADRVFAEAAATVLTIADERRQTPRDDLMTDLVRAEDDGDRLSQDELVAMVLFLVVAGHETTANTICTGLLHLLRHPDQLELLRSDRSLLPSAIEELLRYEPAARNSVPRYPVTDTEVGGVTIRRGEQLYVGHQAANHDPAEFTDPLRLDIRRSPNRHLAFGGGAHYCLGAAFARMELVVAFDALLDRFPTIELASDDIRWRRSFIIRAVETLPLRVSHRTRAESPR